MATRTRLPSKLLRASAAGSACLLLASGALAQSPAESLWRDPAFQKAFVAGYGFNAEIEPRVTPDEVEILEEVRPLMADDLPKAEATLKKRMKPGCSAVLDFTLGGIQFQQGKLEEAVRSHDAAVGKFPSFRRAWRSLGLIHAQATKYDAAIASFTRMIELGGGDGYSYGLLGAAYEAKLDFQASEGAYRNALLLQPERIEWRLGLTRSVLAQEKFEDAANLANSLIALHPDKHEFWMLQARTFLGMKQPLRAAENLEIVDRLGKATPDTLHLLGDIYLSESLPEMAAASYVRAVALDPAQPAAKALRAVELLTQRGATEEADLVAKQVRASCLSAMLDEERSKLFKLEARIGMARGQDGDEVVAVLEEIISIDPLDGDALLMLGQHYARHDDPERAIFYFERAEGVPAFEASARMGHAQTLMKLERYGEAIPLLRRVQELKPREDVARMLEQVERIAKSRR